MTVLATVAATGVRPTVGRFKVVQADQSVAGLLVPGGPPLRVTSGPLSLRYQPPAGDPILREFTINANVPDRYELRGSLYQYCGDAYERERNVPMALRAYQKLLEEKQYPTSEESFRALLPDRMRQLYAGWVDEAGKQGKALGPELAARVEEARKKAPADAIPALMEIYAAKDAGPDVRAAAAAALALVFARQSQPYEAVEWIERTVKEKVDPGPDPVGAVVTAAKGYPGLSERLDVVAAGLEALRKQAQAKADPPTPAPPPPPSIPGLGRKVGSFAVVGRLGLYVALEANTTLSKGDQLDVVRGGTVIGDVMVSDVLPPDKKYPNGSVQVQRGKGNPQSGDEVYLKK
jgi:hypothetical protein